MKKQLTHVQFHMPVVVELSVMNTKARLLEVNVTHACEAIGEFLKIILQIYLSCLKGK